jgi:hypothetical protein
MERKKDKQTEDICYWNDYDDLSFRCGLPSDFSSKFLHVFLVFRHSIYVFRLAEGAQL